MQLESGQRLLHYRLADRIGEGGMGEVWKATDTALGREVALKILPEAFSKDADRQARFEREAKLLASFNHPHIASIFGLHQAGDLLFLAMELVPGEDVAQILRRGPIPVDETLNLALQVANALELAHENGVVHRDLKPANICWTPDKKAKVLDFGLAKAVEAGARSSDPHLSPTVTSARTEAGAILGTAAYMSPEQARGEVVDRRADIWAFGCVLFEALSGKRAFSGDTISDTLVSLLSHEPDWSVLPSHTPPPVRRLLERCLIKDSRRRLRDIGEARIVLEDVIAGKTADPSATRAKNSGQPRRSWIAGAAVAGLVLFGAGFLLRSLGGTPEAELINPDVRVRRLTFSEGLAQEPTLSPDGNYVAYTTDESGNLDIMVLPLAGGNAKRVVEHPADDAQPRWSPDGSRLAFVSARDRSGNLTAVGGIGALSRLVQGNGGDIFLIPALGGSATKLVDQALYPTWAPDGSALAFQSNRGDQWDIWRVSSAGGEPQRLTDDASIDYQPAWSPDGRWVVFCSQDPVTGLRVVPAVGGEKINLFEGRVLSPAWSPDGRWIYFSCDRASTPGNMNLWRIPFRPGDGPIVQPQRVTVGEGSEIGVDVSADGTRLTYSELTDVPDIWSWDPTTGMVEAVTDIDGEEDYPHLAPDGRRLAFVSDRGGTQRIWSLDLVDRSLLQLETSLPADSPRWSPDGTQLVYIEEAEDGQRVVVRRWGDVQARTLASGLSGTTAPQWSPDGAQITVGYQGVWVHSVQGGSVHVVDDEDNSFPTWSPDGSQIAYQREIRGGVREIWAVPAEGGEPRRIAGGGVEYSHPQWSPTDPDRILVVLDHKDMAVLRVSTGEVESVTALGSSRVLVDYPSWSFDGRRAYFSLSRASGDIYTIEGL